MGASSEKATPDDYRLLGLRPYASPLEVKRAFRHLVKKWHPDRYQQRSALERHGAEERFKSIASAYRRIVASWDDDVRRSLSSQRGRSASSGADPSAVSGEAPRGAGSSGSTGTSSSHSRSAGFGFPPRTAAAARSWLAGIPRWSWALLCGLLLLVNLLPWNRLSLWGDPPGSSPHHVTLPAQHPWPVGDSGIGDDTEVEASATGDPSDSFPTNRPRLPSNHGSQSAPSTRTTFSLGATQDEVLRIQGAPDHIRGQTWTYGLSDLSFKDGCVARYNNFGGELRVRLEPASGWLASPPRWVTLGMTSDEVLAVQGTPTRIEGGKWYYGFSEISFKNARVEGFDNYFGALKVRILPSSPEVRFTEDSFFTVGSTMDEVLAVQGTPTSIRGNVWFYQFSNILFRDGRVQSAVDTGNILRFSPPVESARK